MISDEILKDQFNTLAKHRKHWKRKKNQQKNCDFFQDNTTSQKKTNVVKLYTTTRITARNFLSNIAYIGVNEEDSFNRNFVFDVYVLMTKNLNLFFLERKISDQNKHVLWKK